MLSQLGVLCKKRHKREELPIKQRHYRMLDIYCACKTWKYTVEEMTLPLIMLPAISLFTENETLALNQLNNFN